MTKERERRRERREGEHTYTTRDSTSAVDPRVYILITLQEWVLRKLWCVVSWEYVTKVVNNQ